MTFNNEVFHKTSAEVNTQIASYFDVVDQAIKMADTNKKYTIDAQSSYSPGPPVQANSFTTFIISPTCDNTADLYNGFLRAQLNCKFHINQALSNSLDDVQGCAFNRMWFGFKDAMDAVEKYEILTNGISIYTQNFAPEESFITACGVNESVKRADIFSRVRHKDVYHQKVHGCGCFVDWGTDTTTAELKIPLKIDLRRFLPLSNIKYLPAFAGKFELKIMFGTQGMVYCPCGPDMTLKHNAKALSTLTLPEITCEFTQIGDPITCYTSFASNVFTADTRTCTVDRQYNITDAYSVIPNFGIDQPIYNALVQRYMGQELIFPTQALNISPTSSQLAAGKSSSTLTATPRFIDSIFLLFPLKPNHHTVFKNPWFQSLQLRCGGYGNVPTVPFDTICKTDPTFIEICQNAMNVNGLQCGFNKDVFNSLVNDGNYNDTIDTYSHDCTNFFVGLPTETDNTFQQGQSSNTPITYEISSYVSPESDYVKEANRPPPRICFLNDIIISIHVQSNGLPPVVEIGEYDITSRD